MKFGSLYISMTLALVIIFTVSCAPSGEQRQDEKETKSNEGLEQRSDSEKVSKAKNREFPDNLKVIISVQPTQTIAGRAIPGPPTLKVTDQQGEPVEAVQVKVASTFNDFKDISLIEAETDANGKVVFEGLYPTTQSFEHQLLFSSESFDSINSFNFPVVHGHPKKILVQTQPEDTAHDDIVKGPPAILLTDEFGNPTPNVAIEVSESTQSTEFISGATRKRTDINGECVFNDIKLPKGAGYQLEFKANTAGNPTVESQTFSVD